MLNRKSEQRALYPNLVQTISSSYISDNSNYILIISSYLFNFVKIVINNKKNFLFRNSKT